MELFNILNHTVSSPFVIVSADSLKLPFISKKAKELINYDEIKEIFLSDILNYDERMKGIILDNIEVNQNYFLKNHISITITNKYRIDKNNVFISFDLFDDSKNYIEKIRVDNIFKKILLKLSTEFISMPVDSIDENINNALKVLGEFNETDRSYIFQFSNDLKFMSNTHEWCNEGIEPQMEHLQNYPVLKLKYTADLMLSGTPMIVNDVNDLPQSAAAEKEEFQSEKIKSLILLPLMYQKNPIGFIGFDSCNETRKWSDDDVYLLKFVGDIITGAIVREKSEKKLKLSEERYRGFFEHSGLGIFHTSLDGRMIRFNQALFNISGFDSTEEFQREFTTEKRYKNPEDRIKFIEALKKDGYVKGFETTLLKNNNLEFPARLNAKLVNDGSEVFIEGFVEDITEKKAFEDALIIAKDKAEKSDQLKSNFLAQVSHEIRTPINTILSFSQLLAEELKGKIDDDLEYSFSTMDSAGKRIIRTIDLILDMSQIQTGTFELIMKKFDVVDQVVKKLYQEYSYLAEERSLEFKMSIHTAINDVFADVYTVEQILSNLIHNAIKYTDEGSVEIRTVKNKSNYIIEVIDTGIGISKEFIPNLFNPFSQESQGYTRKYEGNGLGLALVQQYCDMNKIKIEVESEKNEGSIFRLIFNKNTK